MYSDILKARNVAVIRHIFKGNRGECVAYATTILTSSVRPEMLLYLTYPMKVKSRQLREVNRLQTHIPAKISISKEQSINSEN